MFHIDHGRGAIRVDKSDVVMGFVFVIVVVIFHGGNELLKGNEGVVVGVKHLKGFSRTFRPVVVVAFHPVVSSSLASFLGLVLVVVFVSVFVMADAVSIIVVAIFHPVVSSSLASILGLVLVVVFVSVFVMADAVFAPAVAIFVAVLVAVLVAVFIAMAVVVCAAHGSDSHGERFHAIRLKLKHIFACFKVVNADNSVSRAASRILDGLFGLELLAVAVVVLIMVVMTFFGVVVVIVLIMTVFIVVILIMVVFREGHVVRCVVAVEFISILCMFSKNVDVGCTWAVERSAKLADQHRFVIKGGLAGGHAVSACNQRTVSGQTSNSAVNPFLEAKSVVEEHIGLAQTNQILA